MARASQHGNEHSVFINGRVYLDQLSDYQRLKDSAPQK
jgi:hypothetical protein